MFITFFFYWLFLPFGTNAHLGPSAFLPSTSCFPNLIYLPIIFLEWPVFNYLLYLSKPGRGCPVPVSGHRGCVTISALNTLLNSAQSFASSAHQRSVLGTRLTRLDRALAPRAVLPWRASPLHVPASSPPASPAVCPTSHAAAKPLLEDLKSLHGKIFFF